MNDEASAIELVGDPNSLRVLDLLATEPLMSQREVSVKMDLSVGLVNLIIRRLATTGYIKVANLSHKRVGYFLTKRGLQEQMRRSYHYLRKTLNTYHEFLKRTTQLIKELEDQGHRKFVVVGEGEVADLVCQSLQQRNNPSLQWRQVPMGSETTRQDGEIILDARFLGENSTPGVSILSAIIGGTRKNSLGSIE